MAKDKYDLANDFKELLAQISFQEHILTEQADNLGVSVYELRTPDGKHPMQELLVAKAHTMHGLAIVRASE